MNHKLFLIALVALIMVSTASQRLLAAARFAVASGNWSGSIWASTAGGAAGSAAVPTSADDVTINNNVTVSITSTANAKSLVVGVSGNTALLRFNATSAQTLNVYGDLNVASGTFNVNNAIGAISHAMVIAGSINVNGGSVFKMKSADATDVCNVTFTKNGNATITGSGTIEFNNIRLNMGTSANNILEVLGVISMSNGGLTLSNGTFKVSSASTLVPFTSDITTSPYLIPNTCGLWCNGATFNSTASCDWTVDGTLRISSGTVNLGIAADDRFRTASGSLIVEGGTFNVAGRITYTSSTPSPLNFNMSGGVINVPTIGSTSTAVAPFDMSVSTGSFTMSGGLINIRRSGGGTNYYGFQCYATTYSVTGGTLQIGDALTPASQTIRIETTVPLYNLTVNSANVTAQLYATPNITVKNNVTIQSGVLNANNINLLVGGNWINNASATAFLPTSAGVTFNGSNPQLITGGFSTNYNHLTINNATTSLSSATVTLLKPIAVAGLLTLNRGYLVTSSASLLNMLASSSSTSGSASSYVNGPMTKTGTTAFVFPVGYENGTKWARIGVGATAASVTFIAQYFALPFMNTTTMATTPTPVLNNVSQMEYWTLQRISGSSNTTVTLYWENALWSGINQCTNSDLRIARWNGAAWENNNDAVTTTGTCSGPVAGTIRTNNPVLQYDVFTFGSLSNPVNPLPVELLMFSAAKSDDGVNLNWSTASEKNNDYFEVQRSSDGYTFSTISKINGAGNSNTYLHYHTMDRKPISGLNYYRLKQVDYDGSFQYSAVRSVNIDLKSIFPFIVYPNPATEFVHILYHDISGTIKPTIMTMDGKIVKHFNDASQSDGQININIESIPAGLYLLVLQNSDTGEKSIHKLQIVR
jgi:hypothetical protein